MIDGVSILDKVPSPNKSRAPAPSANWFLASLQIRPAGTLRLGGEAWRASSSERAENVPLARSNSKTVAPIELVDNTKHLPCRVGD